MPRKPPPESMGLQALRDAWVNRPECRDLLLEIYRLHCVLEEVDTSVRIINEQYRQKAGGHLVACHQLKVLLSKEPALSKLKSTPAGISYPDVRDWPPEPRDVQPLPDAEGIRQVAPAVPRPDGAR